MKKRRPIDVMEATDPHYEHSMIKYPGEEIQDISEENLRRYSTSADKKRLREMVKANEGKKYIMVHNHTKTPWWDVIKYFLPEMGANPSPEDLNNLMTDKNQKTMVIVDRDIKTGKEKGRYVLRKKRGFIEPDYNNRPFKDIYWDPFGDRNIYATKTFWNPYNVTKDFADKNNLRLRVIPAKGYKVTKRGSFVKIDTLTGELKKSLERSVAVVFLSLSVLFLLVSITGNTILSFEKNNSKISGIIFFILGVLFLFISLRKK